MMEAGRELLGVGENQGRTESQMPEKKYSEEGMIDC